MTRVGLAATTGYGKSREMQNWLEKNLPEMDFAVVMDYKDEYRGLVRGVPPSNSETDLCGWVIAGPREVDRSATWWARVIEDGGRLIIPRFRIDGDEWRQVCGRVSDALRILYEEHPGSKLLAAFDEAHVVAPQQGKYPAAVRKVAKVGRGEGLASLWATQELQDIDDRVSGMWDVQILGGFNTDTALGKLNVDYPADVHNLRLSPASCPPLPDELLVDGESIPLRRFYSDEDSLIGAEWIRSDGAEIKRLNTRGTEMASVHYGSQGHDLVSPYA